MPNDGSRGSSSSLTPAEMQVASYFADAECERKRPRNREAYRATILARKTAEILALRASYPALGGIVTQMSDYLASRPVVETAPIDEWVKPDPEVARAAWRAGIEQGRAELGDGTGHSPINTDWLTP